MKRTKMKGIVIYDTTYGNTKKVAETITDTLKSSGIEVDLFHVKDVKKLRGADYDFFALGSPTRMGTMSLTVRFFLGNVKSEEWVNKPFISFDTENPKNTKNKEWCAAEKIAEKLREKKMIQLMPVLVALVLEPNGPLVDGEVDQIKEYSRQLVTKLKDNKL